MLLGDLNCWKIRNIYDEDKTNLFDAGYSNGLVNLKYKQI